jgi:hypothetical protein
MFSYTQWALDWLSKAAGHKYIKRVPYQSGGKMRYRYIYNVTHTHGGKHVLDPDHMKVGTKLMLDATSGAEVHGHIQSVSGDKVTFVYDDGPKKGESVTMSKDKLASELDKVHGISSKLDVARKKQSDVVAKLKEKGASAKQIARAEARLKALGGDTPKAETPKAKPKKAKETKVEDQPEVETKDSAEPTLGGVKVRLARKTVPLVELLAGKATKLSERDRMRVLDALDDVAREFSRAGAERQINSLRYRLGIKNASVTRLIGLLYEKGYITKDDKVEPATLDLALSRIQKEEDDAKKEKNERLRQSLFNYIDKFKSDQLDTRINDLRDAMREDARAMAEHDKQQATHEKFIGARKKLLDDGALNTEAMLSDIENALDDVDISLPRGWKANNVADKAMAYLRKYSHNSREKSAAGKKYRAIYDAVFERANDEALKLTGLTYEEGLEPKRVFPKVPSELRGYDIAIDHLKERASALGLNVFDYIPDDKELQDLAARGL